LAAVTETLLGVAYEIRAGLAGLPWWAVVGWLVLLFAAAIRPGVKASMEPPGPGIGIGTD
jgi:hypothetical protein